MTMRLTGPSAATCDLCGFTFVPSPDLKVGTIKHWDYGSKNCVDVNKVFEFPPMVEVKSEIKECGYCGGTGEVACSSSSYMSCPECSKKGGK